MTPLNLDKDRAEALEQAFVWHGQYMRHLYQGNMFWQQAKEMRKAEGLGDALDAKEIGFSRWHDAWAFCPAACDCCQYVFPAKG